jgi:hypothetical protein
LLLLLLLLLRLFEPAVLDPLSSIDMVMAVRFPGIGRVPVFYYFVLTFLKIFAVINNYCTRTFRKPKISYFSSVLKCIKTQLEGNLSLIF